MKRTQLKSTFIAFCLSCFCISGFSANPIKRKVTMKNICHSWFVGQAWEVKPGGYKKDQSKKAKGSSFIFEQNNTFYLKDRAKRNPQTNEGTFTLFSKDSVLLVLGSQKMKFKVSFLSRDSMTLSGNSYGRNLFIGLSRDSIPPFVPTKGDEVRIYREDQLGYEYEEVPAMEERIAEAETEIIEETIEVPRIEPPEIVKKRNENKLTMSLIGQWKIEDTEEVFFTLSYNQYSVLHVNESKLSGSWTVTGNLIKITNSSGTHSFKISEKRTGSITVRDLGSNRTIILKK